MTRLAAADELPDLLRDPPWTSGRRAPEPPRLELPPRDNAPHLRWSAEEHARLAEQSAQSWWQLAVASTAEQEQFLDRAGVRSEAREGLRAGTRLQPEHLADPAPTDELSTYELAKMPDVVALGLWNALPAACWDGYFNVALHMIVSHGEAAAPGLLAYAARRPVQGLRAGRWLDSPDLAALALNVRRRVKVARVVATDWLLTNRATAAHVVLRQLFGTDDGAREDALASLHDLAANGLGAALDDAARSLGDAAHAGLVAQLDSDPLLRLPTRLPKLPAFFDPSKLHRPRLRSNGAALPDDAMRHLGLMLAISRPDQPYAGVAVVRDACTGDSLAEFAWDVFEAWWAADAPSKDAWAFVTTLSLLGDDATMHRLGPRAMRWAKEKAKNRALAAVDLMGDTGSDAALLHLSNLAERCKVPAVRNRATALVDAVAEQRGLTRTELADRLVPTLGLDEGRTLDFGPRRFTIVIDETLSAHVKDAQGTRLKDLPKPRQTDDAALADAASLRFKQLKKELKAIAKVQLARLEQAMVDQRRWPHDHFLAFFVRHPLTRELAARLVWLVTDGDGRAIGACRIAEDGTLADERDNRYEPASDSWFAIAHPLSMAPDLRAAFGQVFADYEVMQPFAQLARETFTLTRDEIERARIDRVDGRDVPTGVVIALLDRGWLRGGAEDGGMINRVERPLGRSGAQAWLEISPGMFVGQLSSEPRQTLGKVLLRDGDGKPLPADALDPVAASELLRDVNRLAPFDA